tara:strand:- start:14661 stop:17315 length:2655 start_codon:yes stop_codon:yes gene_type:complete
MANRIPLVVDTQDKKIKELPVGDNLDLSGAGITNAGTINATDVRINNVSFNNPFSGDYNDLSNKPIIPTVPSALSAFANDVGYLSAGTTTDQINEGTTNLFFSVARTDARIQAASLQSLGNVDTPLASDDGKVVYWDNASSSFKYKATATELDTLDTVLSRGNSTTRDIITSGKVYFANVFATLSDLQTVSPATYHGMFAHVHQTGKAYYAHAGAWLELANADETIDAIRIAADDSTIRTVTRGESIRIVGGTGATTTSNAEGDITINTSVALDDLTDVVTTGATNGQALIWDNAQSRWEPGTVSSSISELGDLTDVNVTTVAPQNDYALSWSQANNEWRPRPLNNVDAATVTTVADSSAANQYLTFVGATAANGQALRTDAGVLYNPNTNVLTVATINPTTVNATNVNVSGAISNSTNELTISSNVKLPSATQLRFYDGANANYTAFRAPASLTANTTFILPDGDGSADQVLSTNGSGTLSWVDAGAGGGEANQNAFSNVAVAGQTTVSADAETDTLTLVAGTNVTITTDAGTDTITINAAGGSGGTPGGSNTQVQFNDSSSFGGDAGLVYNKTTDTLTGININATTITATTVEADTLQTSGTGVPTFTSASNIIFDAANAVVLQKTPLRLGAFDQDALNALTGQAGDMVYDSNAGDVLFYNGSTWKSTAQQFSFSIGADDSSMKLISRDESIKVIGGTGITTSSDSEGNITITRGAIQLSDLSNVASTAPSSGQVLKWNGSAWAPAADAEGSGGISISSPSAGDMIYYNGSAWVTTQGPVYYYTVSNAGSSAYNFTGPGIANTVNNPALTLYKGSTYIFNNTTGTAHPFAIRNQANGTSFTEGVSGSTTGTQVFTVPHNITDTSLVYQCTIHSGMVGNLTIV